MTENRRRWGQKRIKWLDGISDSMDMSLSQLQKIMKDREAWRAGVPGVTRSRRQLSYWTNNNTYKHLHLLERHIEPKVSVLITSTNSSWLCFLKSIPLPFDSPSESLRQNSWAPLVVEGLRISLPTQRTQVRTLLWEDPTCWEATKSLHHNCWACVLQPTCCDYWHLGT